MAQSLVAHVFFSSKLFVYFDNDDSCVVPVLTSLLLYSPRFPGPVGTCLTAPQISRVQPHISLILHLKNVVPTDFRTRRLFDSAPTFSLH